MLTTHYPRAQQEQKDDYLNFSPQCAADKAKCRQALNTIWGLLLQHDKEQAKNAASRSQHHGPPETPLCAGVMTRDGCQPRGSNHEPAPAPYTPGALQQEVSNIARETILKIGRAHV